MADDANPLDPQSIAELIRRTLESSRPPESSALRQAVAKHAGQPVELEPVLTDLVEASLAEFPASLKRSAVWRPMVRQVAGRLYDDEPTRQRIAAWLARAAQETP